MLAWVFSNASLDFILLFLSVKPEGTFATKLEIYKKTEAEKDDNWIKRPIYIA